MQAASARPMTVRAPLVVEDRVAVRHFYYFYTARHCASISNRITSTRCTSTLREPMFSPSHSIDLVCLQIRFTRMGRKKLPFYRIVAVDSRKRRDGAPLEYLGWYDPIKKEANLNAPAIKKWLSVGALPSDTVNALLKKAMVVE